AAPAALGTTVPHPNAPPARSAANRTSILHRAVPYAPPMPLPDHQSSSERQAGPIVGIDLGTTNSLVAVASFPDAASPPRVIPDEQGRPLLPSVVRFEVDPTGHALPVAIGHAARDNAVEFPR